MKIVWYTTRNFGDMCATTPVEISKRLVERGHELTIINPDKAEDHQDMGWFHRSVWQEKFTPGFRARKIASSMKKSITNDSPKADIFLVDWAILPYMIKTLNGSNTPTIMIDRSPPAYSNLFAKLQWYIWRKSWKLILKGKIESGCVVSNTHKKFVNEKLGIPADKIFVLNAGVDSELFFPMDEISTGPLKFVYHGQMDKNRGIFVLPFFIQNLINNGIDAELTLIGDGNIGSQLRRMKKECPWMNILDSIPYSDIPALLRIHDIGLLPMPNRGIWPLASPLKRGEYLASGLLVFGVNHSGHSLDFIDSRFYKLSNQENFHAEGLEWVRTLTQEKRAKGRREVRAAAKKYLPWDKTVDVLEEAMHNALRNNSN